MDDYIGGINPIREALKASQTRIQKIYLVRGGKGKLAVIRELARESHIPVTEKERRDLDRMAPGVVHQGALALVSPVALMEVEDLFQSPESAQKISLLLILDNIVDPQNLGGLIRSAHVAGADGVIMAPRRSAPITAAVTKASAGAVEHIALIIAPNLARCIDDLKKRGFWVAGADDSATQPLYDLDFTDKTAIVIGNEGTGMRELTRKKCDTLFQIPTKGVIRSLNAAAAGAVALFEVVRQRYTAK